MKTINKIVFILVIMTTTILAQVNYNAKDIANLNAYSIHARGWETIGSNPANLGILGGEKSLNFGIIPMISFPVIDITNSSLSISKLNENFFTGKELTESNKKEILDAISSDGIKGYFHLDQNILKLSLNRWAFGLGFEAFGTANIPKSLIKFGLVGNKFNKPVILNDMNLEMISYGKFSINYGDILANEIINQYVKNFYWGVGIDLLLGTGYEQIKKVNGSINSVIDGFEAKGDAVAKAGAGGLGFAIDLGVSAEINDRIYAGFYLQNIISSINWGSMGMDFIDSDNTKKIEYKYSIFLESHEFFEGNLDSLLDEGVKKDTSYAISKFSTPIPAGYNLNAAYKFSEKFNINGALSNDYGLNTIPNITVSINYNPTEWWPLIVGLGTRHDNQFAWSFGTGLNYDNYRLDIGISQFGGMFNYSKGFTFAINQSIYF